MSWHQACQLDPSLYSLSEFFSQQPAIAQTLIGGLTNRCWKIEFSDHPSVVWRPVTEVTQMFSISRHQEYHILSTLGRHHFPLSPKPIYINEQGLLVGWIEGEPVVANDINLMVRLLTQIHQFPTTELPITPFSYTARVDSYWLKLQSTAIALEEIEPFYSQWRQLPVVVDVPLSLCHFDLGSHNLIRTKVGIKVIDWEYSTLADPRIDLAMTIQASGENMVMAVGRYCQLRGLVQLDDWIQGVKAWTPRVMMLSMLWYLLAYQIWGDETLKQEADKMKRCLSQHEYSH
jgi:thiamine kinase